MLFDSTMLGQKAAGITLKLFHFDSYYRVTPGGLYFYV